MLAKRPLNGADAAVFQPLNEPSKPEVRNGRAELLVQDIGQVDGEYVLLVEAR